MISLFNPTYDLNFIDFFLCTYRLVVSSISDRRTYSSINCISTKRTRSPSIFHTFFFNLRRYLISQYVTLHGDIVSHLNVTQVSVEDGGEYTCTAGNRAGTSSHSARLNIYGNLFANAARLARTRSTATNIRNVRFAYADRVPWTI